MSSSPPDTTQRNQGVWGMSITSNGTGATAATCPYCGLIHKGMCARVKAIEYYQDGTTKRVELHDPTRLPSPSYAPMFSVSAEAPR